MSNGTNGGHAPRKPIEMEDENTHVCSLHHDLSCRTLRVEKDVVAATAVIREEGVELRSLIGNVRANVADVQRTQAEMLSILRRLEDRIA